MRSIHYGLPEDTSQDEVAKLIQQQGEHAGRMAAPELASASRVDM